MATDPVLLKLLAGRATAAQTMPYVSAALYAMTLVESIHVKTAAVDKRWRFYWSRQFIEGLTVPEIATVWLHEVGHVIREHHGRATRHLVPETAMKDWNRAADATINADLRESNIVTFDWMVFPESIDPKAERDSTTESLYDRIPRPAAGQPMPTPSGQAQPSGGEDEDSEGGSGGEPQHQDRDGGPGEPGEPSDGQDDSADGHDPSGGSDERTRDDTSGDPDVDQDDHDCGSGAGGGHRPWEEPADSDGNDGSDGSVSEARAERLRHQVAHDTLEYAASGRGTVPQGFERWAHERAEPQVDWRRELRTVIRRAAATTMGRSDYAYERPRRVKSSPGVVFPSMVGSPPPVTRVVVDTSGSMKPAHLAVCLTEIEQLVRRLGPGAVVDVLTCDAAVSLVQKIRSGSNVALTGGGGTDMRVGIEKAAQTIPTPDLVITLTDGFTPWPDVPPRECPKAKYVAVIIRPESAVQAKYSRRKVDRSMPPAWMHMIWCQTRPD